MIRPILYFIYLIVLSSCCFAQNTWRDNQMQPEMIMDTIGVKPGMVIGEVGAGEGRDHFMTKEAILDSVKKSEYELVQLETFLEKDNIYIFRAKNLTTEDSE